MTAPKMLLVIAAAAGAVAFADPALARNGGASRARAEVAPVAGSSAEGADFSLRMREDGRGRFEFRMTLEDAPEGLAPDAYVADAAGTLTLAGAMTAQAHEPTEYRLRLRSRKGQTLPAGATTIADLSGRAFEVRQGDDLLVVGTIPALGTRTRNDEPGDDRGGSRGGRGRGSDDGPGDDHGGRRGGGADDGSGHDRNDDHGGGRGRRGRRARG